MALLKVALLIIVSVLVVCAGAVQSFAGPPVFDSGTSFAITPEMYNQIQQNQMQQELINSQIQYQQQQMELQRQQNPFMGCVMVGEVSGKDIDEAKGLAQKMGANAIQFTLVTSNFANAKAFACPVNR